MSWIAEVKVDGKYCSNKITFSTESQALEYAVDLFNRWILVESFRAVEVDLPVTHIFWNGHTYNKTNVRETEEYKTMDQVKAWSVLGWQPRREIATDAAERPGERLIAAVWQYVADNGLYLQMEGWYGRQVADLIAAGLIEGKLP
jgi:hypothetical protein